jgi:hypothetical protein
VGEPSSENTWGLSAENVNAIYGEDTTQDAPDTSGVSVDVDIWPRSTMKRASVANVIFATAGNKRTSRLYLLNGLCRSNPLSTVWPMEVCLPHDCGYYR